MTDVYFVRHCQSQKGWKESDSIRPLTKTGEEDSTLVTEALHNVKLDFCICSPYKRSMGTVAQCAQDHGLVLNTDPRLGERLSGKDNNHLELVKRWQNHTYCEPGGECLASVQNRNIEALREILASHAGESILFGTHGTALSTIINYFEPDFGYEGFEKLYSWMPYIIHAVFDGTRLVYREDILVVDRGY